MKMIDTYNEDSKALETAYFNKENFLNILADSKDSDEINKLDKKYQSIKKLYIDELKKYVSQFEKFNKLRYEYEDEIFDALLQMEDYEDGFFELNKKVKFKLVGCNYNLIMRRHEGYFLIEVDNCFGLMEIPLYGYNSDYEKKYMFYTKELVL